MPHNLTIKLVASDQPQTQPPERALISAMILRAISDILYVGKHELPASKRTARAWIVNWTSTDTEHTPFSFPWCCYHLDLDPTLLRDLILTKTRSKNIGDILSFRTRRHKGRNSYK